MVKKRQRIGATIAALIFLVSSLATSIAVIWYMATNDSTNTNTNESDTSQAQQESETNELIGTQIPNFTTMAKVDSLQVTDVKEGTGAVVAPTSTVTVTYTGALANNGTIFDATAEGQPATFALNQVIPGWQEGLVGMKVGGTRRMYIPAALAYGDQSPAASIPANSDLYFEVTLLDVK